MARAVTEKNADEREDGIVEERRRHDIICVRIITTSSLILLTHENRIFKES